MLATRCRYIDQFGRVFNESPYLERYAVCRAPALYYENPLARRR